MLKETRKFGGETFHYVLTSGDKSDLDKVAKIMRNNNIKTRLLPLSRGGGRTKLFELFARPKPSNMAMSKMQKEAGQGSGR